MSQEIVTIVLTDVELHVIKPRKPLSVARAIEKSLRNGKPGRFYSRDFNTVPTQPGTLKFSIPLSKDMLDLKEELEKEGKQVRFVLPPGGVNVYAGKDMIEFIEAQEKKTVSALIHSSFSKAITW